MKRKGRGSPIDPSGPYPLFKSIPQQRPSAAVGRGRRKRAAQRLIGQCAELGASPGSVALAVAWQHAAVSLALRPGNLRIAPLEQLGHPTELAREAARLSARWSHLRDHLPTIQRLISELPSWDRLIAAASADDIAAYVSTPAEAGEWYDPAGDVLKALRDNVNGYDVLEYCTPPSVAAAVVDKVAPNSGASILDPMCGTGRLLSSAASWLWARGRNPWTCGFFGVDVDHEAVAIACFNLIGVGAGPHVWLHCGEPNTEFVHPDGTPLRKWVDLLLADFNQMPTQLSGIREQVVVDPAQRWRAWQAAGSSVGPLAALQHPYLPGRR